MKKTLNWKILNINFKTETILEILLKNRGIKSKKDIDEFLNPPFAKEYLYKLDTVFKKSLKQAKEIVNKHIKKLNPIIIYGDYDADGICAVAAMSGYFTNELKYPNIISFIPSRFEHGYGMSIKAIDNLLNTNFNLKPKDALFITVDSGITAKTETEYIKSLGYDIIITDHHQKPKELPKADCIVWNDKLVGTSIAWIITLILGSKNKSSICLSAIATVTDLFPLKKFNRSIVREGLDILNEKPPYWFRSIMNISGKSKNVSASDLGWIIGPRLNASGRLTDASLPLQLLTEKNKETIDTLALKLNSINTDRQDKTLKMYKLAELEYDKTPPKIIFSESENYHEGIIGLVAAKLSQNHYRPAIVICTLEREAKGSVRSIKEIDIIALLHRFDDLFINLGGHPMAAGFTIYKKNIPKLKKKLLKVLETEFDEDIFTPTLEIDANLPISHANAKLIEDINKLRPFGVENREPLFASQNIGLVATQQIGKEKQHLKMNFIKDGCYYKGIMFNGGKYSDILIPGTSIDIAFQVKENYFNGNKNIDLIVKDFKLL